MDEGFGAGTPVLLGCWGFSREGRAGEAGCLRGEGPSPLPCSELDTVLQRAAAVLGISRVISEGSHCTQIKKKNQTKLKERYFISILAKDDNS